MNTIKHFFTLFILALATLSVAQSVSPCAVPSGIYIATQTAAKVEFQWNAILNAIGYQVQMFESVGSNPEATLVHDTTVTNTNFRANGLKPSQKYTIKLATQCGRNLLSKKTTFMVKTSDSPECPAPTGFQMVGANPTSLKFSWNPSPNATSYRLRVTGPGGVLNLDTTFNETTFVVTGLQPNTTYTATLNANCGPKNPSDQVTIIAKTSGIIIVDVVERTNKNDIPSGVCDRLKGINCTGGFLTLPTAGGTWPTVLGTTWVYQISIEKNGVKSQVVFTCKRNTPSGSTPKFTLTNYVDCANCRPCAFCQQNSPPKGPYLPYDPAFLSIVLSNTDTIRIDLTDSGFTVKINTFTPANQGYTVTYKKCLL